MDRVDTARQEPSRVGVGADRGQSVQTHSQTAERRAPDYLRLDERAAMVRERLESKIDRQQSQTLRADVKEARAYVKDWDAKSISKDTATRYTKTVENLRQSGSRPEDALSKSNFTFQRAAVVHEARKEVKTALRDLDKARRSGDVDRAAHAYNRMREGLATLRQYPPSTGNRAQDMRRQSVYHGPRQTPPERSNGKRTSINSQPHDWRDRVQEQLSERDKPQAAVMSLSGARPAELKGLKVRTDKDNDRIVIEIRGAKYDDERGIKIRSVTISRDELEKTEVGRDLRDWLGNRPVRTLPQTNTKALSERIATASEKAGLDRVTAYSYRHQFARDLREEGYTKSEIAERLGHRSEKSQREYG